MSKKEAQAEPTLVERKVLLQRLSALEMQVKALQHQTEVQLQAFRSSIGKLSAMVAGSLPPVELAEVTGEEDAAPQDTAPAPSPAASPVVSSPAGGGTMCQVQIGKGVIRTDAPMAPDDLPHLLHAPAAAPTAAMAGTTQLKPEAASPAPTPVVSDHESARQSLERKLQQVRAWEAAPQAKLQTEALTLSFEEISELRKAVRKDPEDTLENQVGSEATTRPEPSKRTGPDEAQETADVPYPADVQRSKRLMFEFKEAIQQIMTHPVIPETNELISVEMRDELSWYSRLILEDFLSMHAKAKQKAAERYRSVTRLNPKLTDPLLFWDPDTVDEYRAYRTSTYIEKFLDHLEGEIMELREPRYYQLLDFLAEVMSLERRQVEAGKTRYHAGLHQVDAAQARELEDEEIEGRVIVQVQKSGYLDTIADELIRPAIVRLHHERKREAETVDAVEEKRESDDLKLDWVSLEDDEDEFEEEVEEDTQPLRQVLYTPEIGDDAPIEEGYDMVASNASSPMGQEPAYEIDEPEMPYEERQEPVKSGRRASMPMANGPAASSNRMDIPTPPDVTRCQNHIFSLKMAVATITRENRLPLSGHELDQEIAELLSESSTRYLRGFVQLHKEGLAKAGQRATELARQPVDVRDPSAYWGTELVESYRLYRTTVFIESFMDKLEARIISRHLTDHQELIDNLAMEMELGRLGVTPNVTRFDPERHTLAAPAPADADLRSTTILAVLKSGYTDLATGQVTRKAVVSIKLKQFTPGGTA